MGIVAVVDCAGCKAILPARCFVVVQGFHVGDDGVVSASRGREAGVGGEGVSVGFERFFHVAHESIVFAFDAPPHEWDGGEVVFERSENARVDACEGGGHAVFEAHGVSVSGVFVESCMNVLVLFVDLDEGGEEFVVDLAIRWVGLVGVGDANVVC